MTRTISFTFNTVKGDANNGKIVVQCGQTDGVGEETDFFVGITSPSGEVIKAYPGSADLALEATQSDEILVDIPLDSNGNYLGGTYTFQWAKNSNAYGDLSGTDTYVYNPLVAPDNLSSSMAVLSVGFKCLNGLISVEDETDYDSNGVTVSDRTITITPPSIDTQSVVEEDAATASMTVAYTNVTYQVQLEVEFEYEEVDLGDNNTATAIGSFLIYREVDVDCETGGICGSLPCVSAEMDKVHDAACAAGGFSKLPQSTKDKMMWSLMNLALAKMHYDCGNVETSLTYVTRATEAVNCGCGCSDASTSTPAAYTPPAA